MSSPYLEINQYDFNNKLSEKITHNHFVKDAWPLVYILSDDKTKTAYVGETADTYNRLETHFKNEKKGKLTSVHLIASDKFNKSATLDIESNLIRYMLGDNVYQLLNANLGLANHNYYQKKEVYWEIFKDVWRELRAKGITKHSLKHINNSDLFKYSPYKSLTKEQSKGLYEILKSISKGTYKNTLVEGGAGTGKSIMAIFLFKLLSSELDDFNFREFGSEEKEFIQLVKEIRARFPKPKMGLVIPMTSFRATLKKVFKNIKGLSPKMVIGPTEVSKEKYDILVVDESHRLRQRKNLTNYKSFDDGCKRLGLDINKHHELDWVQLQAKNIILFYDEDQSIKPTDVPKLAFDKIKAASNTNFLKLKSQLRVKAGEDYVQFIDDLLKVSLKKDASKYTSKKYEFLLFDDIQNLRNQIKERNKEHGLARVVAGFSWKWISKNDKGKRDITIEGHKIMWNGTAEDWINSESSIDEIGCIHTTQGYDLNYAGIVFGKEIDYDPIKQEIVVLKENYHDPKGKNGIKNPEILKNYIVNIYKTMLLRGIKGTYLYACNPNLNTYLASFVPKFIEKEEPFVPHFFNEEEITPYVDAVPFYDLKIAAGGFSDMQLTEDKKWIKVLNRKSLHKDLFVCQVIGESMNKVIPNGSYCLFKSDSGGSRNGKITLVKSADIQDADSGANYTIKEYESKKSISEEGWKHEAITLKPLSTDTNYKNIYLKNDELTPVKVIGIFECVLE